MGKHKVEALVDYFEFSVPYDSKADLVAVLPCGVEELRNKRGEAVGWRGYQRSGFVAQGEGRIGWSPEDRRMGVHVSLGSRALGVLAALDPRWADLPAMMRYILEDLGGHTTRIDLAFDDKSGLLDMGEIGSALREGRYVSRWRKWRYFESAEPTEDGMIVGESYYLGSSKSDTQLRVYDKRAERLQKGAEVAVDHWIRCELELRRKRSDAASRLWLKVKEEGEAVMVKLAGALRGLVEFKDPSTDTNKQRQPIATWWAQFLGWAEKAKLAAVEAEARTLEDVRAWVSRQVAPSLALLEEGMGFDKAWAFLYAEAKEGRHRWRPRHKAILKASAL